MTLAETLLATLAILATPGPTNAMMTVAGAERGPAALRLLPLMLLCYLAVVAPLAIAGAALLDGLPVARTVVTLLAAAWALRLAASLWRPPAAGVEAATPRRVAVTTLLNPKGLVLGLEFLPAEGSRLLANLAGFAAMAVLIAGAWTLAGIAARGRRVDPGLPRPWRRAASAWMAVLAVWLVTRALA